MSEQFGFGQSLLLFLAEIPLSMSRFVALNLSYYLSHLFNAPVFRIESLGYLKSCSIEEAIIKHLKFSMIPPTGILFA